MYKKSKYKALKIITDVLRLSWFVYLLSSFPFSVVFYVQHAHKSCPFLLLEFMVFNSSGDKVALTCITPKFLPGHKFFPSSLPSSHYIYPVGKVQFIT